MAIYRFRVSFEDNEEIYREIEIKSTQNFEDFHNIIVQSVNFDNHLPASFYISDDYWRKGDEITLKPVSEDEADQRKRKELAPKKQMNKAKIVSVIDDPHQKFVYVYDLKTGWSFLVELLKIVAEDPKTSYPKIAKSVGEAPKQYKQTAAVAPNPDDEEFDEDDVHNDDEAYVAAHSEDETALLEGEEGEEEVASDDDEQNEPEDEDGGEFDEGGAQDGDDF